MIGFPYHPMWLHAVGPEAEPVARDVVDPAPFGVVGDGTTDDTAALQRALDACAERGGVVRMRPGSYAVRGRLNVPDFTTLEGVASSPAGFGEGKGTRLLAYADRGREEGSPFITLNGSSTLKGVAVFYPEQTGDPVVPYPWCVGGAGKDNLAVVDCLLVNPYQGIDLASTPCPRHFIRRVYGYPLCRGIAVDQCFDIGRIENVHFWPFWNAGSAQRRVYDFVQHNGEAFSFAMTDWQYVFNTFCWGYRIGYRFAETERGVCNGNFLGIGADACNASVWVDSCAPYGVLITNGQFVALYGERPTQIVVSAANSGVIQFNNCSFWGPCSQCARIEGKGHVSFNQCHFLEWDPHRTGFPCIEARSGLVAVNGCRFAKGAESVWLGADVRGGIVSGNLFASRDAVRLEPGSNATVEANGFELPPADPAPDSRVISVLGPEVTLEGDWWDYAGRGSYTGVAYFCFRRDEPALFRWDLAPAHPGVYTLSAWLPKWMPPARGEGRATYRIRHAGGEDTIEVLQSRETERWVPLGRYHFDAHSQVSLEGLPGATLIADCMLLTRAGGG